MKCKKNLNSEFKTLITPVSDMKSAYIQGVHAGLQRWMEMWTETFLQVLQTSFISLAHEHYLDMLLFGH